MILSDEFIHKKGHLLSWKMTFLRYSFFVEYLLLGNFIQNF